MASPRNTAGRARRVVAIVVVSVVVGLAMFVSRVRARQAASTGTSDASVR